MAMTRRAFEGRVPVGSSSLPLDGKEKIAVVRQTTILLTRLFFSLREITENNMLDGGNHLRTFPIVRSLAKVYGGSLEREMTTTTTTSRPLVCQSEHLIC